MNTTLMYRRIRNYCGFLGMILPWLALFSAGIAEHPAPSWWYSISATYYQTPALVAVLTSASIVLMTYDGYSTLDNVVTTISGVFGIGIVLFPCSVSWLQGNVGFFQLPIKTSHVIHCTCAALFFVLLAYNSLFLFTRTSEGTVPTERKLIRNRIYRVCGLGMVVFLIWQVISTLFLPSYWTMINEIFLLQFFGISWLTKGGLIFPDKE